MLTIIFLTRDGTGPAGNLKIMYLFEKQTSAFTNNSEILSSSE
jgi:hypothetical protein